MYEIRLETHFKVRRQLFDNRFPRDETLDEDIGRLEVVQFDVLLDEALVAAERRVSAFAAAAACARRGAGERAIWGGIAVHVCATRGAECL